MGVAARDLSLAAPPASLALKHPEAPDDHFTLLLTLLVSTTMRGLTSIPVMDQPARGRQGQFSATGSGAV